MRRWARRQPKVLLVVVVCAFFIVLYVGIRLLILFDWPALPVSFHQLFNSTPRGGMQDLTTVSAAKQLILLAGQSNMAGRGLLAQAPSYLVQSPFSDKEDLNFHGADRVFRWTMADEWEVAREPLHWDVDTSKPGGIGPGFVFTLHLRTLLHGKGSESPLLGPVGVIPCAQGNTRIEQWKPGRGFYYERMLSRTKAALGSHPQNNLAMLLWYQGESDAIEADDAQKYAERFRHMLTSFREAIGRPDLPVVMVLPYVDAPHRMPLIADVREQQKTLLGTIPNLIQVDSKGLPLHQDNIHLSTDAQLQLGQRMAAAYLDARFDQFVHDI
eukprot:TRINITY_DN15285_c0_g1_i1.p1 TRINITY_DN15285_c0_g1~~TRINITY_DN15285_c0_g1_i1.p1  ORF type:complete len:327 (+),score=31.66 TRINITY_DN15285_c0_g1_i1:30-1010(+)